jgi:hypothetical protein
LSVLTWKESRRLHATAAPRTKEARNPTGAATPNPASDSPPISALHSSRLASSRQARYRTTVPVTAPAPDIFMRTPSSFRCVAPVVALFAVNCAVEESVEPDAGSGDRSDAGNVEPIYEVLPEDDPNLVCCWRQEVSDCNRVCWGGRRPCHLPQSSCNADYDTRLEANNRREVTVNGCPVWEAIDAERTRCIPADAGSRDDIRRDP